MRINKSVDDDRQQRLINDILDNHQNNLKELAGGIFVEKELQFKQNADSLYAKIAEVEARRKLDRKLGK